MVFDGQQKSLKEAAERYAQEISAETLAVLDARGISEEVAAKYRLGTVTDPATGHEAHEGWLSIPYFTASDICVGFKFRRLDDAKPKYGSPTGQKTHLYNVSDVLIDSSFIVVCEGELDTVIVSGVLGIPAVGSPGVAAWKPWYPRLLLGYDTVFIAGDNDEREDKEENPGQLFSKKVASEVSNSTVVSLPAGMDITDYYLQYGHDATRRLLVGERK